MSNYDSFGYALAMRVMQSDLYPQLDERERSECDELIHRGQNPRKPRVSKRPPLYFEDETMAGGLAQDAEQNAEGKAK